MLDNYLVRILSDGLNDDDDDEVDLGMVEDTARRLYPNDFLVIVSRRPFLYVYQDVGGGDGNTIHIHNAPSIKRPWAGEWL